MLDLPLNDAAAFRTWFTSREWEGAHPFEIAYGIPHGIVLWPHVDESGWRFTLSVSDEMYHKESLLMVIALDQAGIPFDFGPRQILNQLEGTDSVEVGPDRRQIPLERLLRDRPDAAEHIRWSPVPPMLPVTDKSRARIEASKQPG